MVFQVGCTVGSSIFGTGSGYLFEKVSPMSVWYTNLACTIVQVMTFCILDFGFAKADDGVYSKLETEEMVDSDEFDDN